MKKKLLLSVCLLALLSLAGCTRHKENEELTLSSPEASVVFTGTITDGVRTGTVTGDGWSFEGTLGESSLQDGTAENLPCSAAVGGIVADGTYTGTLVSGMPDGEGVFTLPSGAVFSGEFSAGTAVRGAAEDLPWNYTHGGSRYSGTYTGALEAGVPEGEGSFEGENGAKLRFSWEGGWSAGEPSGEGMLTDDRCVTTVEGTELAGAYDGEGKDGVPDGEGTFSGADSEDVAFTYTGSWSAGLMNGQGTLRYESELRYVREGTFTAGCYTPTDVEMLAALGTCEPCFTLTDAQRSYLAECSDLWERADHQSFFESTYDALAVGGASIAGCFSSEDYREDPYWMEIYAMRIITAHTGVLVSGGREMTLIMALDSSFEYPCLVLVPGSVDRLTEGNRFHIYALPLAVSTYTNTLGEECQCLVMIAGDIYTGM